MTTACASRSLFILMVVVFIGDSVMSQQQMSEICMGCICEASSSCDRTLGCNERGVCGLFSITRPYWIDGGMPVITGDDKRRIGAFERCVVDPYCAADTVHAYMTKYAKDCDNNGVINCKDYAAIHNLGAGCEGTVYPAYQKDLDKCLKKFNIN